MRPVDTTAPQWLHHPRVCCRSTQPEVPLRTEPPSRPPLRQKRASRPGPRPCRVPRTPAPGARTRGKLLPPHDDDGVPDRHVAEQRPGGVQGLAAEQCVADTGLELPVAHLEDDEEHGKEADEEDHRLAELRKVGARVRLSGLRDLDPPRQAEAEEDVEDVGAERVADGHVALPLLGDDDRRERIRHRGADGEDEQADNQLGDLEDARGARGGVDHDEGEEADPHDRHGEGDEVPRLEPLLAAVGDGELHGERQRQGDDVEDAGPLLLLLRLRVLLLLLLGAPLAGEHARRRSLLVHRRVLGRRGQLRRGGVAVEARVEQHDVVLDDEQVGRGGDLRHRALLEAPHPLLLELRPLDDLDDHRVHDHDGDVADVHHRERRGLRLGHEAVVHEDEHGHERQEVDEGVPGERPPEEVEGAPRAEAREADDDAQVEDGGADDRSDTRVAGREEDGDERCEELGGRGAGRHEGCAGDVL
mmetsp:Transcript_26984/g.79742  ORF Transcript_26984/g.79742 Transcript_26984/m.79742 type:complete len:474 (-) Transcript_26984:22-1443(-)